MHLGICDAWLAQQEREHRDRLEACASNEKTPNARRLRVDDECEHAERDGHGAFNGEEDTEDVPPGHAAKSLRFAELDESDEKGKRGKEADVQHMVTAKYGMPGPKRIARPAAIRMTPPTMPTAPTSCRYFASNAATAAKSASTPSARAYEPKPVRIAAGVDGAVDVKYHTKATHKTHRAASVA